MLVIRVSNHTLLKPILVGRHGSIRIPVRIAVLVSPDCLILNDWHAVRAQWDPRLEFLLRFKSPSLPLWADFLRRSDATRQSLLDKLFFGHICELIDTKLERCIQSVVSLNLKVVDLKRIVPILHMI